MRGEDRRTKRLKTKVIAFILSMGSLLAVKLGSTGDISCELESNMLVWLTW